MPRAPDPGRQSRPQTGTPATPPTPATRLRSPQQARSRDTLRRIVAATRALLQEKTFDEISIAEITRRARSSVGAFYTRFPDKDALLDYLDELYMADVLAATDEFSQSSYLRGGGAPLAEVIAALIEQLVRFHRERSGLLRTLIVEARRRRGGSFSERTQRMTASVQGLLKTLLSCRDEIGHPDPQLAVTLGFVMIFSAVRETILFPESLPEGAAVDDEVLIRELTCGYLAYLRAEPPT